MQNDPQEKVDSMSAGILAIIILYGVVQIFTGWVGIHDSFGFGWAFAALLAAFMFRFSLPLTIGSFLCALNVWDWHWLGALVFAAPGLAFMVVLVSGDVAGWFRSRTGVVDAAPQAYQDSSESLSGQTLGVDLEDSPADWLVCGMEHEIQWFWSEDHRVIDPSEAGVFTKQEALNFLDSRNLEEDSALNGLMPRTEAIRKYEAERSKVKQKNKRSDIIFFVVLGAFFVWLWSR